MEKLKENRCWFDFLCMHHKGSPCVYFIPKGKTEGIKCSASMTSGVAVSATLPSRK